MHHTSLSPEAIRAKAREMRVVEQFHPDNAQALYKELGGVATSAWFAQADGTKHQAVRVTSDLPVPFKRRATLLLKGAMVLHDPITGSIFAMQNDRFSKIYSRAFSDGEPIADLLESPAKQAQKLMTANNQLQMKLQEVLSTSTAKSWLKWRSNKQQQAMMDVWNADIAAHLQDLKRLAG